MPTTLSDEARALLEAPNFAHVATLRKDGAVHLVPVWVDVEGDRVVLNTGEGRAWPNNVLREPRVTLTVQNIENPYEYVQIRGRVTETTRDGANEHIDRMAQKYLGEETYPGHQPGEERMIVRIEPEWTKYRG